MHSSMESADRRPSDKPITKAALPCHPLRQEAESNFASFFQELRQMHRVVRSVFGPPASVGYSIAPDSLARDRLKGTINLVSQLGVARDIQFTIRGTSIWIADKTFHYRSRGVRRSDYPAERREDLVRRLADVLAGFFAA